MIDQTDLVPSLKQLEEAFGDDTDLLLFFVTWLKHNLNAKAAYLELHPGVTPHSAEVLGSRILRKVEPSILMSVYGLGVERYFEQLRDGLDAIKVNEFDGSVLPDHSARKPYHDKLGRLLGIETSGPVVQINQQTNVMTMSDVAKRIRERKEASQ